MDGYGGHRDCPKIDLTTRATNTETGVFYKSIGYVAETLIALGKRLESR